MCGLTAIIFENIAKVMMQRTLMGSFVCTFNSIFIPQLTAKSHLKSALSLTWVHCGSGNVCGPFRTCTELGAVFDRIAIALRNTHKKSSQLQKIFLVSALVLLHLSCSVNRAAESVKPAARRNKENQDKAQIFNHDGASKFQLRYNLFFTKTN